MHYAVDVIIIRDHNSAFFNDGFLLGIDRAFNDVASAGCDRIHIDHFIFVFNVIPNGIIDVRCRKSDQSGKDDACSTHEEGVYGMSSPVANKSFAEPEIGLAF